MKALYANAVFTHEEQDEENLVDLEQVLWNSMDSFHHCDVIIGILATSIKGVKHDERREDFIYFLPVASDTVNWIINEIKLE